MKYAKKTLVARERLSIGCSATILYLKCLSNHRIATILKYNINTTAVI